MKISILTLFPEMFQGPFDYSIIKRAQQKKLIEINIINIRDFGIGKHKIVDDTPYGGGSGMILRPDVLHTAIQKTKEKTINSQPHTVLLSASGYPYTQKKARKFVQYGHLLLVCGHYEGIDERITNYVDEEISIGDFVTTGGEIPAMLITDSVARLIPGTLKEGVTENESYSLSGEDNETYLEHPHYTKPLEYENIKVPEILLSGNHKKINEWRLKKAKQKTSLIRPDLLKRNQE